MNVGYDVARWLMANVPSPADTSRPLELTESQIDLLVDAYQPGIRRIGLQQPKGYGKSPLAALMALAEFAGPVASDSPLVQIHALSEEQATSTVYSLLLGLLRANERELATKLGIDDGRGRLYLAGRPGKLEAVTSAAGSHEGERTTFAVLDETHLWTRRNGGLALARTVRRNIGKSGGRTLELSNAPELGLGSVAEATLGDVAAGHAGILLVANRPSRTPEPSDDDETLLEALRQVYDGVPWVSIERILAEVRDPQTLWAEALRYYFNAPAGGSAGLVEPAVWDALEDPGEIEDGSRVALGFDGSYSQDGTALVAVDEAGRLSLELLIERIPSDPPDWTVPRQEVSEAVADTFARFDVVRMFADPYHWRDEIAGWAREHGEKRVIEMPTNSVRRFGVAVDRFRTAIAEGRISHDGDADLRRHLLNARLVRGRGAASDDGHALYTLEKPGPGRLIDAAVASVLAVEAMASADVAVELRESLFAWG